MAKLIFSVLLLGVASAIPPSSLRCGVSNPIPTHFHLQLVTTAAHGNGELLQSIDKRAHAGYLTGFARHGHFLGYKPETVQIYRHDAKTGYFTTTDGKGTLFVDRPGGPRNNAVILQGYNPKAALRISCQIDFCTHLLTDCTVGQAPRLTHLAISADDVGNFETVDPKFHNGEYLVQIRAVPARP